MAETATTTPTPFSRLWRVLHSIGAVLAGLLANVVIVGAIDAALRAIEIYPPTYQPMAEHLWALALTYRLVFNIVSGYIATRVAPNRPMLHVMVLGGIGTVMSALFVAANWNKTEFGPHWFALSAVISCLPLTVLGGVLHAKRIARTHK